MNARLAMQLLGKLAKATKYVTPYGFVNRPKRMTSSNYFVHRNYGACSVADGVATVDYSKLIFAEGSLMPPIVSVSYATEGHALSFQVTADSEDFPGCRPTDKVYAVVLDSEYNHCKLAELCNRGDGLDRQEKRRKWLGDRSRVRVWSVAEGERGECENRRRFWGGMLFLTD